MAVVLQLKFEEDLQITRMFSGEDEEVPFQEVMYPRGNVEDWLCEVERVMMESLRKIMEEALEDYKTVSRSGTTTRWEVATERLPQDGESL